MGKSIMEYHGFDIKLDPNDYKFWVDLEGENESFDSMAEAKAATEVKILLHGGIMAKKDKDVEVSDRLPGMEDPAIEELERGAKAYAKVRDKRQAATKLEVAEKTSLLGLMKKNKRTEYNHAGVSISVVVESEKIKVKIKDEDEDE